MFLGWEGGAGGGGAGGRAPACVGVNTPKKNPSTMTIGTTSGTSDAFPACRKRGHVGRTSLGQPRRLAWMKITVIRHAAVTAAGIKPPRQIPTTDVTVICASTITKSARG